MSNRREFIRQGLWLTAGMLLHLPFAEARSRKTIKITILHTNDIHSHIDAFDDNHPSFANQGGLLSLQTRIKEIRATEQHVLLFDCGDVFQGTPYFNLYGGAVEFKTMSAMGYDAGTMGNHDFDNGYPHFKKIIEQHCSFPILNANYGFQTEAASTKIQPHKIIETAGKKIGVFGIGIKLEGLVDSKNYEGVTYLDPIETANQTVDHLRQQHCDYIICLSHLGYQYDSADKPSDHTLAAQSSHIDMILGGHTHTFLDAPVYVNNLNNKKVLINQAGWAGLRLGRIDIVL